MTTFCPCGHDILCQCGHGRDEHARTWARCRGRDSYGLRCACPRWESDACDLDRDDDQDDGR